MHYFNNMHFHLYGDTIELGSKFTNLIVPLSARFKPYKLMTLKLTSPTCPANKDPWSKGK